MTGTSQDKPALRFRNSVNLYRRIFDPEIIVIIVWNMIDRGQRVVSLWSAHALADWTTKD